MRVALFDLDGTLTDNREGITRCTQEGFVAAGVSAPAADQVASVIGIPLQEMFLQLGLDDALLPTALQGFEQRYSAVGKFENVVYAGVPDALQQLMDDGWTLAVATSKPEVHAQAILERFNLAQHFTTVAGATLDGSRRTKADVIARALDLLGVDPGECLMIGDRREDIEGARHHGIETVGVTWGFGHVDELNGVRSVADAAQLVQTLNELSSTLGSKTPPALELD